MRVGTKGKSSTDHKSAPTVCFHFFSNLLDKNCTVTLNPIGSGRASSCKSITASRTSRSLLSDGSRSEEHTSELQSLAYLVCRLLLEKKKKIVFDPCRYAHAAQSFQRQAASGL